MSVARDIGTVALLAVCWGLVAVFALGVVKAVADTDVGVVADLRRPLPHDRTTGPRPDELEPR